MASIIGILSGVIMCWIVSLLLKDYANKHNWSKNKWWVISCFLTAVLFFALAAIIN